MKILSLKLDEDIYKETEELLDRINKSRNRYINDALQFYNSMQKKKILQKQLEEESKMVSKESMSVLEEFENFDDYES